MWRRLLSPQLRAVAGLSSCRSTLSKQTRFPLVAERAASSIFTRRISAAAAETAVKKRVEDIMPIATGHEREELETELKGLNLLEINYPMGPFGTKEAPSVIKSYYDKRIVGCPGGEGEDEHDVVWFWLEKGKPHECSVCSQHFVLEVVGPEGPPDGHGDDDHH